MGGGYKQDLRHATSPSVFVATCRCQRLNLLTSNEGQTGECATLSFKFSSDKILINFNPGWQVITGGLGAESGGKGSVMNFRMTSLSVCDRQALRSPSVDSYTFPSLPMCLLLQLIKQILLCSVWLSWTVSDMQPNILHLSSCGDNVWTDAADCEVVLL